MTIEDGKLLWVFDQATFGCDRVGKLRENNDIILAFLSEQNALPVEFPIDMKTAIKDTITPEKNE
jgi:hypothetical protein